MQVKNLFGIVDIVLMVMINISLLNLQGSWGLLLVAIIEVSAISWIYGVENFIKDIEMMIGEKPKAFWWFWQACWLVITPLLVKYF